MPTFISAGKPIRLDHYPPDHAGNSPAIILIHGSGGPLHGLDPFASQAAMFGVHVFVLHYFERTGHNWVAPSQIESHFLDWLETVKDAVSFVAGQTGIDANRIGLLGFSLGAFLSLALATQDSRIAAVAELFGGLPEHFVKDAGNLPPVLILHGAQDTTVPIDQAHELERILQQHKIPYQIKIYPDQGHVFRGVAQLDAMYRVTQFFRDYLLRTA
jgi:dipeptidyl aminopeptidase/acylaminoacyl peptidase